MQQEQRAGATDRRSDFVFSDDQLDLRRTVRRYLAEQVGRDLLRSVVDGDVGSDPALWTRMGGALGLAGTLISEEYGGQGLAVLDALVIAEEMGRALVPVPWLSTNLAARALQSSHSESQRSRWLPTLADGSRVAAFAHGEGDLGWASPVTARVEQDRSGRSLLTGAKTFVLDAPIADVLLVSAADESGGTQLLIVRAEQPEVRVQRLQSIDPLRTLGDVEFSGAEAEVLDVDSAAAVCAQLELLAGCLLSWEMVGAAERCLEMATDYALTRHQFGRPIGSFQAIKHRLADMLIQVETARSAAYRAGWDLGGDATAEANTHMALAYCGEALIEVAAENIQVHGGMGFTWEHDAHLYLRRARSDLGILGSPSHHRRILAQHLGLTSR